MVELCLVEGWWGEVDGWRAEVRVCGGHVGGHVACGGVCEEADVVRGCERWGVSGGEGVLAVAGVYDMDWLDLRGGV